MILERKEDENNTHYSHQYRSNAKQNPTDRNKQNQNYPVHLAYESCKRDVTNKIYGRLVIAFYRIAMDIFHYWSASSSTGATRHST